MSGESVDGDASVRNSKLGYLREKQTLLFNQS